MIVSGGSAPILAIAEFDAWSVAVNPRLSAPEVDRLRAHGDARRVFFHELPDATRRHADIFVVRGSGTGDIGPLNRETVPERVKVDLPHAAGALV